MRQDARTRVPARRPEPAPARPLVNIGRRGSYHDGVASRTVLLNVDAGELASEPDALYGAAHLVHVACGGHAGDEASMRRVVTLAAAAGTAIGAHPSYPDREGFGRRSLTITHDTLARSLREQCAALDVVSRSERIPVYSVKPHGALYHDAHRDPALAHVVVDAARDVFGADVAIVGPAGGALAAAARERSLSFLREAFADRATRPDGSLIPRGEPGALITDPAAASECVAVLLGRGGVDTVCVHGDTQGALDIARAVREALDRIGAVD